MGLVERGFLGVNAIGILRRVGKPCPAVLLLSCRRIAHLVQENGVELDLLRREVERHRSASVALQVEVEKLKLQKAAAPITKPTPTGSPAALAHTAMSSH